MIINFFLSKIWNFLSKFLFLSKKKSFTWRKIHFSFTSFVSVAYVVLCFIFNFFSVVLLDSILSWFYFFSYYFILIFLYSQYNNNKLSQNFFSYSFYQLKNFLEKKIHSNYEKFEEKIWNFEFQFFSSLIIRFVVNLMSLTPPLFLLLKFFTRFSIKFFKKIKKIKFRTSHSMISMHNELKIKTEENSVWKFLSAIIKIKENFLLIFFYLSVRDFLCTEKCARLFEFVCENLFQIACLFLFK